MLHRHAEMLRLSFDAIIVWRLDGAIESWNRGAEELYGFSEAEAVGRVTHDMLQTVFPAPWAEIEAQLRKVGRWEGELRHVAKDGREVFVSARKLLIPGADGVTRVMETNRDVTERKRAEDALREADRRKDEFLAVLGHELRNPISSISNCVRTLQPGVDDAKAEGIRVMMARQVAHLVRLVDDLLEVSRISQGRIALRKERIDLVQVVKDATAFSRPLFTEFRHRLTVSLPSAAIPLEADPTRLAQVLINLLSNAAKFTAPGGRIAISTRVEDGEVIVSVRDNGVGIPPDELPRIFELFTRFDRGLDPPHTGLGVGLALSRNLVELHGGRIEARSDGLGRGSEFVVRLPIAASSVAEAPAGATIGATAEAVARRVVVVDDNRDVADSFVMLLEALGADVRVAYGGRAALTIVAEFKPEMVFLDLSMPEMDGYETARRLRQLPDGRGVELLAVTGWSQEKDRLRALEAGFDGHLTKPVEFGVLKEILLSGRR